MCDQVLRWLRISRDDDRTASIINPIPERRLDRAMIDEKCGYLHTIGVVSDSLADIHGNDFDSVWREFLVHIAPDVDIKCKCLLQVIHHGFCAAGTPHLQWRFSSLRCPGKQI